jgi:copper(I)-binding protein
MRFFVIFAAALVPTLAFAGLGIKVDHSHVTHTDKVGQSSIAYFEIHNTGNADDILTGWDCTIATKTQLVDGSGNPLQTLTIPAGQTVTLSPKGPHLELTGTYFTINYGGEVPCRMTFKNAGDLGVYLQEPDPPK